MALETIDEVINALDRIVERSHDDRNRVGYFAAMYRRVTCAVRDNISAGSFDNCSLMERLDVGFASRYLDALATFQSGGKATQSWMLAFQGCENANLLIVQQLMSGMNAHINLDLGIAAAQAAPGGQLAELKADFDQINGVLASITGIIFAEMAALSPLIGELEKIGLHTQTSLVNFDIKAARQAAWLTAERLTHQPSVLHDATIAGLDVAVSLAGSAILYPVIAGDCLELIQAAECKDVRLVIETLSQGYSTGVGKAVSTG